MTIPSFISYRFSKILALIARFLDAPGKEALIYRIIQNDVSRLSSPAALKFLFKLDLLSYQLQSGIAIEYENLEHPKHRVTQYHEYFTNKISANERVIDVGCGKGAVAYDLASRTGAIVLGVDINPMSIEIAKNKYIHKDLQFEVADALELSVGERFDTVVLSNVLEHVSERVQFLKQLQLKTNCKRFLIRVPVFERDWRIALKRELNIEWRLDFDHKTEFTDSESFFQETKKADLEILELTIRWGEIWAELCPIR